MAVVIGNNDSQLSPYLKVWIGPVGSPKLICAAMGEGTSKEITANWASPFEADSLASQAGRVEGGLQATTDTATISQLNSLQVWNGNHPYTFNLALKFYALTNPASEVEMALQALEKLVAPNLNSAVPFGRIPDRVSICIGNRLLYKECVITSITIPLDKQRDSQGRMIRCDVDLQVQTIEMINQPDVAGTYVYDSP